MLAWIKEHPYLAGALTLGLILLLWLFFRKPAASSQGSSSASPSDSVSVAGLQTNAAIQSMAYQAQTQVAGYNAAVNIAALKDAAATSIANNQTGGAVALGLAQSEDQVRIASIAAGGIAPYSVAGTPGYNATYTVGHAQVQPIAAAAGVQQNLVIDQTSHAIAQAAGSGTPIPSATPVSMPSGQTIEVTPGNAGAAVQSSSDSGYYGAQQAVGAQVPSAAGLDWYTYMNNVRALFRPTIGQGGTPDPTAIGYNQALEQAAQAEYLTDPHSQHNMVAA